MRILYFDCFGGINGQMSLGAFIELGVKKEYIIDHLAKLNMFRVNINIEKLHNGHLSGTKAEFIRNDMVSEVELHQSNEYLNGFKLLGNFEDIIRIIESSELNDYIKDKSKSILSILVNTECKVNNKKIYDIEFNKAKWVNYLLNTVAILICIDYIKPDIIKCSKVEVGSGVMNVEGRAIPLPRQITSEILKGLPIKSESYGIETIDELGAAILLALNMEFTNRKDFIIKSIGYGAVKSTEDNFYIGLRLFIGECEDIIESSNLQMQNEAALLIKYESGIIDKQYILECNIDDMNSEIYDFLMVRLIKNGALDVYFTPIIMKKGRPAIKISILCIGERMAELQEILFLETTTFGLRSYEVEKNMLQRSFEKVNTIYGSITVKVGYYKGKKIKCKPEFDECRKLAEEFGIPIRDIYNEALKNIEL